MGMCIQGQRSYQDVSNVGLWEEPNTRRVQHFGLPSTISKGYRKVGNSSLAFQFED